MPSTYTYITAHFCCMSALDLHHEFRSRTSCTSAMSLQGTAIKPVCLLANWFCSSLHRCLSNWPRESGLKSQVELIPRDISGTNAEALYATYDLLNTPHKLQGVVGCWRSSQTKVVHEVLQLPNLDLAQISFRLFTVTNVYGYKVMIICVIFVQSIQERDHTCRKPTSSSHAENWNCLSLTRSLTYSPTYPLTHPPTHQFTHSQLH